MTIGFCTQLSIIYTFNYIFVVTIRYEGINCTAGVISNMAHSDLSETPGGASGTGGK